MSVNQTNGLSAANIVSTYLDAYPGSRQLIMVVKALLSQRHLNEVFNGGLGSYSIICIVISFLQVSSNLPCQIPSVQGIQLSPAEGAMNLRHLPIETLTTIDAPQDPPRPHQP